jgi:hypothetical protein
VVVDRELSGAEGSELLAALAEGSWAAGRERSALLAVLESGSPLVCGRSFHFGYDLDGVVVLPAGHRRPGDWVRAEFAAATPFDVWATEV